MSKASEHRRQAKELRNAAGATNHQVTRETLLKFAEEYDRMAEHPVESERKKYMKVRHMKGWNSK